jgi:hypothetical protein
MFEQKRLADLRAAASASGYQNDGFSHDHVETEGAVKFSRVGRGKLVKVEGQILLPCFGSCKHHRVTSRDDPHESPLLSPPSGSVVCCHGCGGWVRVSHGTPPGTSSSFTLRLEGESRVSAFIGAVHEDFSDWEGEKWPHTGSW